MKKIICTLFVLTCFVGLSFGQLNFAVGYNTAFGSFSETNDIIRAYNSNENLTFEKPFKEIHFLHGISLGARYKTPSFAFSLAWNNATRNIESVALVSDTEGLDKPLYFSSNSLSFGLENYYGAIGLGVSIDRKSFGVKTDISGTETNKTIFKESNWAGSVYLILQIQESDWVSLSLQPYVQLPLGEYDLTKLAGELNTSSTSGENSLIYGLRLVFYNGWQD